MNCLSNHTVRHYDGGHQEIYGTRRSSNISDPSIAETDQVHAGANTEATTGVGESFFDPMLRGNCSVNKPLTLYWCPCSLHI